MTKHKAKFIFHMKVPMNEEDELTDMDKQDIALHIQPGFTGWREKLLLYLPNLMQNSKIDSQWFVHPINEFVRKHHMLDSEGKLQLNTQTDDKHKLALMYRLWLLIKKECDIIECRIVASVLNKNIMLNLPKDCTKSTRERMNI